MTTKLAVILVKQWLDAGILLHPERQDGGGLKLSWRQFSTMRTSKSILCWVVALIFLIWHFFRYIDLVVSCVLFWNSGFDIPYSTLLKAFEQGTLYSPNWEGTLSIFCRTLHIWNFDCWLERCLFVVADLLKAYALSNIPLNTIMKHCTGTALFLVWCPRFVCLDVMFILFFSSNTHWLGRIPRNALFSMTGILFRKCVWEVVWETYL